MVLNSLSVFDCFIPDRTLNNLDDLEDLELELWEAFCEGRSRTTTWMSVSSVNWKGRFWTGAVIPPIEDRAILGNDITSGAGMGLPVAVNFTLE